MIPLSIWPSNKVRIRKYYKFSNKFPNSQQLEDKLKNMFPSGFPVLCSSGRSAINIVLFYQNQKRANMIGVNSYTSHCVLDAISRIATPIRWDPKNIHIKTRLLYHQWGYIQKEDLLIDTIDDCVDTLCESGTQLFPTSKFFEIWSLPKILGTSSGAVLWCRNKKTADNIKNIRNERGGGFLFWLLRNLGYLNKNLYWLWQGIEPQKGKLSKIELFEINNAINLWDQIVADRKYKLDLLWKFAPKWLKKPTKRLPCVVPIEFDDYKFNKKLNNLKIKVKHFEKVNNNFGRLLIKVFPLPIHQDISIKSLKKIVSYL